MVKPACSEEEFIDLCRQYGNAEKVAKHLGVVVRKVHERRRNIEKKRGIDIHFWANKQNAITQYASERGHAPQNWKYGWDKRDDISVFVINPEFGGKGYEAALDSTLERIRKHAPKYPKVKYPKATKGGHQLLLNLTDWHFGAWGLEEAKKTAQRAVADALQKSSGFDLEKIVLIVGNDLLHVDNVHYTTTKGTPQIMDGSTWDQAYMAALTCYTESIESLVPLSRLEVVLCSGNHDEMSSFTLAQTLKAWFRHAPIAWQVGAEPRKYLRFGNSLIGFTHGDKVKPNELPLIVAQEAADWSNCVWRYVYMGHQHHAHSMKFEPLKSHPGIHLEWTTSPKPSDEWHMGRGLIGARGATAFVHSKEGGQEARFDLNIQ